MRLGIGTFIAAGFIAGGAIAAPVTIDDFSTTVMQVVGAPSLIGGVNPNTNGGPTTDAIGGYRSFTAERTSPVGAPPFGRQVQIAVSGGQARVSLGSGTEGTARFLWNGNDPINGLGGTDLTDGGSNDRIDINILSSDLGGIDYTLSLDGVPVTKTTVGTGNQILSYALSEFGAEDGTDINEISLLITGPAAFDAIFNFVGAEPPETVPLPAGGLLILGGLAALGATRRRRK